MLTDAEDEFRLNKLNLFWPEGSNPICSQSVCENDSIVIL